MVGVARNGYIEAADTIARESVLGVGVKVGCNVFGSSRMNRVERARSFTLVVLLACLQHAPVDTRHIGHKRVCEDRWHSDQDKNGELNHDGGAGSARTSHRDEIR